ncbi:MAG: 4-hydroxy-tetrahydrodipicolinate synthase [Clostridia bacterium]|nr:4-hydroxy-tetrahydrodipicolinate synthase [Clostridia bacterium]MBQ9703882.1 4-hydroxy-tetrahydrodipicolinate synthase [Clostridia bacterium]
MKSIKEVFTGCATALVTPFTESGVDYKSLGALIDWQIEMGADALVILGTTGESATIDEYERRELISFARERINKRAPMIVGTGSNSTKRTQNFTYDAEKYGADGILAVTPYYNKASISGLIQHYKSVAEATTLPVILYNVPSRTGLDMGTPTLEGLYDTKNIVAVKEASGSVTRTVRILSAFGDRYTVYSGCDELILPILSIGGKGVISAVSNIVPSEISTLCREFFKGNIKESAKIQLSLYKLIEEMFAEVNPIPVKTALSLMGKCTDTFRLPMCKSTRKGQIEAVLKEYKLL